MLLTLLLLAQDVDRRHVEEVRDARREYVVVQGGTMDGENCRTPVGGGWGVWSQTWESNRAVRLENVGDTDVINPWVSNGRNDFRSLREIVAGALKPGMSEREKAVALWRRQTTHRFHCGAMERAEMHDPVKVYNVYGYTTCGDDSVCLATLWREAGLESRPARMPGHCVPQVFYDGGWHLMDGDMRAFYLLRDNATIASERDLVRDHDLVKRAHGTGILDPSRRADNEKAAALYVYEGDAPGERPSSSRGATMNMTLRPGEALVWRWDRREPVKYHGRSDLGSWPGALRNIRNGQWIYRPDFAGEAWMRTVEVMDGLRVRPGEIAAEAGKTGVVVWKMRSPYVFVGGELKADGEGVKLWISWDGSVWRETGRNLDPLFPSDGPARYEYWIKCELPPGARLTRLEVLNDLQMAPLAMPAMVVGENRFTYTGTGHVRLTHEWVERSTSTPPAAPEGGSFDGAGFRWTSQAPDHHFELSDRTDFAWPLSTNFEKLISNTADRGTSRYTLPGPGLLTPGRTYHWRVRARNADGLWGPWSATWSFAADGPALPADVRLDGGVLRWTSNAPLHRVYGSDEKGFSISDAPYQAVGAERPFDANFLGETGETSLAVLGDGAPNKAYYRVVAVDAQGRRSGPSDYAAAPRPFLFGRLPSSAKVGETYAARVFTIRSLGDLRFRQEEGDRNKQEAKFWDVEEPRFAISEGPAWLRVDARDGTLRGVPDAAGEIEVVLTVALEKRTRRLNEARLAWGHEVVTGVEAETLGRATRRFRVSVAP
ncbi:MAG TPA: hypothetical protein VF950_03175 [Planctomycetota bacterium]